MTRVKLPFNFTIYEQADVSAFSTFTKHKMLVNFVHDRTPMSNAKQLKNVRVIMKSLHSYKTNRFRMQKNELINLIESNLTF
jgi:hypothetical protein